ncbi:DinB family protein [Mucilaginibacter gracilis]|uniref:DinB family protein n=1 Tax=Mucilaginibacter gracilis TaxID=423350 RepID=A0A495J079_9SPHI|nr:DinB family protein [Mucilaginibacter gracilis]RKR81499.1 DinB family protein [Mucilaginibacter gracilis]
MSIASLKKTLENTLMEYRRRLDVIPDSEFNATPPGGGWSYGEVYSHILQANLASLVAIERCANGTGKIDDKRLGLPAQFIFLVGSFPIKFKAPEKIAAQVNNIGKEEARNLLVKLKTRIEQLAPVINKSSTFSKIKHPSLGLLNAKQWLRFIDIHTRHHLKQLNRIEKKFKGG